MSGQKTCTKCGRPMRYCADGCCKKEARIVPCTPGCPDSAIIPTVTVASVSDMKGLTGCFVHVADINTTFYVDDNGAVITTWAGLASIPDYDFDTNPLRLRNQIAYDSAQNIAGIYDEIGNLLKIQISDIANNYNLLDNKPSINGVTLVGELSLDNIGIESITNNEIDEIVEEE